MTFIDFVAEWRPSAILDSSDTHWDHPQRVLAVLYCANFGWNQCSGFDNTVLIFCALSLKTSILSSKIKICRFLGDITIN